MRRTSLWLMAFALLALPTLAQAAQSTPACGAAAFLSSLAKTPQGSGTYQPLPSEQHLFYGLTGLGQDSSLEVRYLVGGKPFLTEVVDLAHARLPKANPDGAKAKPALDLATLLKGEQMIELLALRPDLVRELHKLAQRDAAIRIEVRQQGRLFDSLSFQDLKQRGTELTKRPAMLLMAQSSVSGPGDLRPVAKPRLPRVKDYLENCNDCTESTPCDTECGYDPGKGGPETCGEYGAPCLSTCQCSYTPWTHWSNWYAINSYYTGPSYCYVSDSFGDSTWFEYYVVEYRRDQIQTTYTCPNCPSCDGCYDQDTVISYETTYTYCLADTYQFCFFGDTACCSAPFCSFNNYCNWSC
ncbi:MAG TPA: hypothetical protein VFR03_06385 [Thermoanaerobaculia bacterium]|nr:hypothetical protein [Thermoanaerobaculia bacterium]